MRQLRGQAGRPDEEHGGEQQHDREVAVPLEA
jgi:hypothetical protein